MRALIATFIAGFVLQFGIGAQAQQVGQKVKLVCKRAGITTTYSYKVYDITPEGYDLTPPYETDFIYKNPVTLIEYAVKREIAAFLRYEDNFAILESAYSIRYSTLAGERVVDYRQSSTTTIDQSIPNGAERKNAQIVETYKNLLSGATSSSTIAKHCKIVWDN